MEALAVLDKLARRELSDYDVFEKINDRVHVFVLVIFDSLRASYISFGEIINIKSYIFFTHYVKKMGPPM